MSRLGNVGARLYRGEVAYDFVGKQKRWYAISLVITVIALVGLFGRGLNMGIEFDGGAVFTVPKSDTSISQARSAVTDVVGAEKDVIVQKLGNSGLRIQVAGIETSTADKAKADLAKKIDMPVNKIDAQVVGPSWGQEISKKAWTGLWIFLVLVAIYLAMAFEWRMAIAALVALVHDLVITVGVYALVGFEVTPGTVVGLLTILGYSLYDTVVVFDTVKENTKGITGQNRRTFSEAANHGLNQVLVRSINTSVVALLPVGALLFVGGGLLGAGMLNDIALALFVGLAAGAYSSIFIATPLMADIRERQPEMRALAKRVAARRASEQAKAEKAERVAAGAAEKVEDEVTEESLVSPAASTKGQPRTPATAGAASGGRRKQPASRGRGKSRPSGKRR